MAFDWVRVKFALFVVDGINVKGVENETFTGIFNQAYDLRAEINATYYDNNKYIRGNFGKSTVNYIESQIEYIAARITSAGLTERGEELDSLITI